MKSNREKNHTVYCLPTSVFFLNEMMGLFCGELEKDFLVDRKNVDTVMIRYPLTNTLFVIRLDICNRKTSCFHWHILASNCKDTIHADQELSFDECIQYVKLHRYGRSMHAYYSYAV